jgi:hypothetical protein
VVIKARKVLRPRKQKVTEADEEEEAETAMVKKQKLEEEVV